MRFDFIRAKKAEFPIRAMSCVLGVSRQGYFQYAKREESARQRRDAELLRPIRNAHADSRGTYGRRRVAARLRKDGVDVGRRRVARLMREAGLQGFRRRRFRVTTQSNPNDRYEPNLLARKFEAKAPDETWGTDITYVRTHEGWAFLAVVLDLYARRVVGWALDDAMPAELVLTALSNARISRGGSPRVHHSDRGCQYTSFHHT